MRICEKPLVSQPWSEILFKNHNIFGRPVFPHEVRGVFRAAIILNLTKHCKYIGDDHELWSTCKKSVFGNMADCSAAHILKVDAERAAQAAKEAKEALGALPPINYLEFKEFMTQSPKDVSVSLHGPYRSHIEDVKLALDNYHDGDLSLMSLHSLVAEIINHVDNTVKPEWVAAVLPYLDGDVTTPSPEMGAVFPVIAESDDATAAGPSCSPTEAGDKIPDPPKIHVDEGPLDLPPIFCRMISI